MAKRNIETDHGLTARMFVTGLFLVLLYGVIMTGLFLLTKSYALVLVIGVGAIFAQYWFSARIALFSMQAKVVTPTEEPQLHAIVDRLCVLANMPKPQVAVAETDVPNAFATGRTPSAAVICATRGLMRRLPDEELEAVLAHELSHVAHRDVAVMTIASSVGMLAGLISRMAMWGMMFSGNDRDGESLALVELVAMLVSFLVYVLSWLLTLALSRYRELSADRSGAILIGKPSVLASALQRITGDIAKIPSRDLRKVETMNAFFFTPAVVGQLARRAAVDAPQPREAPRPARRARARDGSRVVGLLDVLRGRTKQAPANLDAIFALPTAAITLESACSLVPTGHGGICFKAGSGAADAEARHEIDALLADEQDPTTIRRVDDDLGFTWIVVDDPDLSSLVTRLHGANETLEEHGLGDAPAVRGRRVHRRAGLLGQRAVLPRLPLQAGHLLPVRPARRRAARQRAGAAPARPARGRPADRAGPREVARAVGAPGR